MDNRSYILSELVSLVGGELTGEGNTVITGFAPIETAGKGDISFLVKADSDLLAHFKGSAVIVPRKIGPADFPLIRVDDPYLASAKIHTFILARDFQATGVHPLAYVGETTVLPEKISVAPLAVVGERVRLGERISIGPGVVIGDDVEIGDDTEIRANVTIEKGCRIGKRVILYPGAVIGSDGYGYATDKRGFHTKRPQVGIVQLDDEVEVGANSCIDRAAYGVTHIKSGTKIDNLVQIAHNVEIGENCLLVSQVGISGSTTLGRNVVLGGQAGITGHICLGDGVMVGAQSGVHNNQKPGTKIGGSPSLPIKTYVRAAIQYGKLPEMGRDIRLLKKEVAELKEKKQ